MDLAVAIRDYEADGSEFHQSRLNELLENKLEQEAWRESTISSLSKLLSIGDIYSPLAWNVLRLLESICNSPQDVEVSKLQKLVPAVSRLTDAAVTEEKKLCILRVLQALTYSLKIVRPDLFVAPLISVLVKWAKERNQKSVVQLSLSVLVNILHRNPIALSTLIQTVNMKDFMISLLHIRSDILCRMEVCELMFLLEDLIYEKPHEVEVVNFIKVSMCTLIDFKSQTKSQLQHCVFFFGDMVKEKKINSSHLDQPWFLESVTKIISILESDIDAATSMLLLKFLGIFIDLRVEGMLLLNRRFMQTAVTLVRKHQRRATDALMFMESILRQSDDGCDGLREEDLIQVLLPLLSKGAGDKPDFTFLTSLVTFCSAAVDLKVHLSVFTENLNSKMIESLLEGLPQKLHRTNYSNSEPVVKMCIYIFHFVCKMVGYDSSWIKFLTCLFSDERNVSILAFALMQGTSELKSKVLSVICSVGFPGESLAQLAKLMNDCGNRKFIEEDNDSNESLLPSSNALSSFEIKTLLSSVKDLIKQEKDIPLSKILQLYERKEQLNVDYQKSLVSCLSESTREIAMLQEEVEIANQISSTFLHELDDLRPSFDDLRQKYDLTLKTLDERNKELDDFKHQLSQELSSCRQTVLNLTETVERQKQEIISHSKNAQEFKTEIQKRVDQCSHYEEALKEKDSASKLQENKINDLLKEQEKKVSEMDSLKQEVERLNSLLTSKGKEILLLEHDKNAKAKEIAELKRIKEMVFEITGGRKKL